MICTVRDRVSRHENLLGHGDVQTQKLPSQWNNQEFSMPYSVFCRINNAEAALKDNAIQESQACAGASDGLIALTQSTRNLQEHEMQSKQLGGLMRCLERTYFSTWAEMIQDPALENGLQVLVAEGEHVRPTWRASAIARASSAA